MAAATFGLFLIDEIYDAFSQVLAVDPFSENALKYARDMTKAMFDPSDITENNYDRRQDRDLGQTSIGTKIFDKKKCKDDGTQKVKNEAGNYIGLVYAQFYNHGPIVVKHSRSKAAVSLNNVVDTFLSYFAQYHNRAAVEPNYCAEIGLKDKSNIVTDDPTYIYKINAGSSITEEDAKSGLFYDTLFNQLCIMGWTENNEVKDQSYLQEMLKNGMMFISSIGDDAYYYQENYNTNTFVKEKSDDSFIAQAEAKYTKQKARLTSKEDELDLKMKNLDTEISSLTTEYDSVKSVIDKNIEKSFKRYDA